MLNKSALPKKFQEDFQRQMNCTYSSETNFKIIDYIARCRNENNTVVWTEFINNNVRTFMWTNYIETPLESKLYNLKRGMTPAQIKGIEAIGRLIWNPTHRQVSVAKYQKADAV